MGKFESIQHNQVMSCVFQIVANLECGPDVIDAEHLILSNDRTRTLLTLCFTVCLSHCYLPIGLIETTTVSIAKNKSGNLINSKHYRHIALAAIISKILSVLLL